MSGRCPYPERFMWGAATSAYQIEGDPLADGAGPSIWQRFAHTPGQTSNGDTGDIATDHYHRVEDDVRLMRELGLAAYRFSIAWGRVLPEGTGRVNAAGVAFYDRLVDTLLEHGITPMATLYHWDLPAALDDRGGWMNRDVADWFAEYAVVVFRALGDRVPLWVTLNEPWVVMHNGYAVGVNAPGHRSLYEPPIVGHNLLRAHGKAVQAYRTEGKRQIGLAVNLEPKQPASDRAEDIAATQRADAYVNRYFLDPVYLGQYPAEVPEMFGAAWPDFPASDWEGIRQPFDFLGVNYYARRVTQTSPSEWPTRTESVPQSPLSRTHTEMGWEVFPAGLTEALVGVKERYGDRALYITENGAAFYDPPHAIDGRVDDPLRVSYLREHLRAAHDAIAQGVDLRGYFAWSLLDNFEWNHGYTKRFGIVHVDFETQARTPKESARFYTEVIRTNGANLGA